jgi:hypothetical protein
VTAHKAQGATLESVCVLGPEDLYREWGYTALSRHREHARFYLVSPGSAERGLPGLESDPDPLLTKLHKTLGDSRAKHLALDDVEQEAIRQTDTDRELLERYRALETEAEVARAEHERAEVERARVEERLVDLGNERSALWPWQRQRRAELAQHVAGHVEAVEHWRAIAQDGAEVLKGARRRLDAFLHEDGERVAELLRNAHVADVRMWRARCEELRDALADPPQRLVDRLGPRPEAFGERETWLQDAGALLSDHAAASSLDRGAGVESTAAPAPVVPEAADIGPDLGP